MRRIGLTLLLLLAASVASAEVIVFADYSDPDVIRVGDDYYLVASSFSAVPGLPIAYAAPRLPSPDFDRVQPGNGIWAPSLRHHDGWFWIFYGDPDRGIYRTRARDPRGPWEPLTLIKAAKGWIDPCPLWDDDGQLYLVHAWAKSRAGFNGVLTVNKLTADGGAVLDDGVVVFDGREHHPTIEGPKFYKRNGWYYIFAPAGGVKRGWQTVLRSKNVYGPYEDRIAFDEPGMHQGALVEGMTGDWFIHFQDRGAYGRVVHRSRLKWVNEWPEIEGVGGGGWGVGVRGAGWQWQGNPRRDFYSLHHGKLRLSNAPANLQEATNLLLQKFPAPAFTATVSVDPAPLKVGERAGLVVFGLDYSALTIEHRREGFFVRRVTARDGGLEVEEGVAKIARAPLQLQVTVAPQAVARFRYDGKPLGSAFVARPGKWVGAKVGLFGRADFDSFRIEPFEPADPASLVVAQDGSGDFRTIQEAVDAIPPANDEYQIILIRNGVYREKVMLAKSYVALVGEDRDKTRVEFAELRRNWRASHPDDWGAAVINIADGATDIIVANLTVLNDYGRTHDGEDDHQFAIRSMGLSNRIAVLHAKVIADGGDTFSPWNAESGLTYAVDSYFEGHVDFVCPRGWAYITNSRFFGRNLSASIWHDGDHDPDQKLVIRHSAFDGVPNFPLGRNHRDAQFYLLDVAFSANMADRAIYPAGAGLGRYYYSNAHRQAGDYAWFADNLASAAGAPRDEDITASWTFRGQWDPASLPSVLPFAAIPEPENGWRFADPAGVTLRWTPARNAKTQQVYFGTNAEVTQSPGHPVPGNRATGQPGNQFNTGPLEPGKTYYWRVDDGPTWSFRADPRTPRIALVGDSTVTDKSGWGRGFESYVAASAAVDNLARGGRSSKSYRDEGHWDDVLRRRPTHILLQFGHNDEPGKGLERETDLPAFRANMARYVDEARAIGAIPILVTSLPRRYADPYLGKYAEGTRQVARDKNVTLIDLNVKAQEFGDLSIGPLKSDGTIDKTHLNAEGSAVIGALMANEVRAAVPSLAPYIRAAEVKKPKGAWSARMADSVMKRNPDAATVDGNRWEYTPGLVMKAMFEVAQRTGDERYFKYAKSYYDAFINADGTIRGYNKDDYNIDRINPGKPLFLLYEKTKDEKYRKAIELLRQQMREHPRTSEGGFWHKKRYPYQMWLDGLYMGAPFLAQYAKTFGEPALFDDVINQYVLMEKHARDGKSGLLYHGWDEKRAQKWADPETGRSPAFWGRAMGWYAMGLVETLDYVPLDHPRRGELIAILQRLAEAVTRVQDPKTGVWWQVVDQPSREGNYLESSASAMLAFALLKSTRLGYLDPKYRANARRAYDGVVKQFIEVDADGVVNITKACAVAGLGGDPEKGERYRSGTFDYYVSEPVRSNDPKAVGPFIFASLEMERQ